MIHLVGDLQGCCSAFDRLLAEIGFSPSRDRLVLLGDLVNRGPDSLGVLRRLRALGDAATCLLGNHDLHLLAVAQGVRRAHRSDTVGEILAAPDCEAWLDWLRQRRLACVESGWLCVHAGVVPQWDTERTLALAAEVEALLAGPDLHHFLQVMRIRFCSADGELEFDTKDGAGAAPAGYWPWYQVPGRASAAQPIAFGHWSTLGLIDSPTLLSIDTGCVWGGALTAVRVDGGRREVVQVPCAGPLSTHT